VAGGKYKSLNEAGRRNGICGCSMLRKWIKQHGREDMLPKRIKVETMNEIDELREARMRIRELEAAPAGAHMDYCLESAFLNIACGRLGTSAEELKNLRPLRPEIHSRMRRIVQNHAPYDLPPFGLPA
jgi:transposase-like protein